MSSAKGILLTGPGTYTHLLTNALSEGNRLQAVIKYYPEWELVSSNGRSVRIPLYKYSVWALWAAWRRLPYWGQFEHPRTWHFALYDYLARLHFPPEAQFLWAWSGTSLFTMRHAKRLGLPVFLEFPAAHPRFWAELATKTYRSLPLSKGRFGILPESLIRRQEAEIKSADKVVVLSSFAKRTLIEKGVPSEKIAIIPLGVEANVFTPASRLLRSPFRVVYVGRIDPLKGVHVLLKAWERLNLPQAELWIVGHVVPEMQRVLAQYEGRFRLIQALSREKLPDLYRQATVLVFPTLMDAFGLVLLEAMASGLPVIATQNSAAPDVLEEGIIPADDGEALQAALLDFYKRRDLEDIGRANRERVERGYTAAHYYQRVNRLLEEHGL
ncbi:MAG: glycosyltransferase [Bacteroidia bacterium]|nr:glycosyltransferase [Bacteroidia bacterium]